MIDDADMQGIMHAVRAAKADCLSSPDIVAKTYPNANPGIIVACGRAPFPSISGNPPVDKKRPYLDLRNTRADSAARELPPFAPTCFPAAVR